MNGDVFCSILALLWVVFWGSVLANGAMQHYKDREK